MGYASDTVLGQVTNQVALTAVTFANGDTGQIRNFVPPATALLKNLIRQGATAGAVSVRSPLLHDNVRGIQVTLAETPSLFALPPQIGQGLQPQDVLIVSAQSGGANSTAVALDVYYSDLPGVSSRLHSWGDIAGNIDNIKPLTVAVTSSATIGQWTDTVITTTENLLHANTDYAVLGIVTDTALCVMGVKGIDTGNLRVCVPGLTTTTDTSQWFVEQSNLHGMPMIPVINSANAGGTFISVGAASASVAANVQLILAELHTNLSS